MNWDAVAAIGEIVGALSVLVTLGFLAVQVRDGKRVQQEANALARAAASDKALEHFSGFRRLVAADAEVTRIWLAGCAGERLEAADQERFRWLAAEFVFSFVMWAGRMESVGLPARTEDAARALANQLRERVGLRPVWDDMAKLMSPSAREAVSRALSEPSE